MAPLPHVTTVEEDADIDVGERHDEGCQLLEVAATVGPA
jgi:hypothetical protein